MPGGAVGRVASSAGRPSAPRTSRKPGMSPPTAKRPSAGKSISSAAAVACVGEARVRDEDLRLAVVDDVRDLGPDEVPVDRDRGRSRPGCTARYSSNTSSRVREQHRDGVAGLEAHARAGRARAGCTTPAARPPRSRRSSGSTSARWSGFALAMSQKPSVAGTSVVLIGLLGSRSTSGRPRRWRCAWPSGSRACRRACAGSRRSRAAAAEPCSPRASCGRTPGGRRASAPRRRAP